MKKIYLLVPLLAFAFPLLVFARTHHHRNNPPPPVVVPPVVPPVVFTVPPPVTPPPVSGVQTGSFNGSGQTKFGTITGVFIGTGDDFTQDVSGLHGELVVYWEPSLTAQQIASGAADSSILKWASEMKQYNGSIIFVVMDEMNLPESAYSGDPTAFKQAFQRVHNLYSADSNVLFAYDPNVAYSGNPVSNFTAYYPGDAYVSLVALDGFDFGGQTFSQVFSSSLAAMKSDFPSKPLWILSTGSVDSPTAFIQSAYGSGVQGIVWFSYQQFALSSASISTIQTF
jgi:hypothetical protein